MPDNAHPVDAMTPDDLRRMDAMVRAIVSQMKPPRGMRFDMTVNLGHAFMAGSILIGASSIWIAQARTDERQDGQIAEAARRVTTLETSQVRGDTAMNQVQITLARIDGRMAGVEQSQQRLERRLEDSTR